MTTEETAKKAKEDKEKMTTDKDRMSAGERYNYEMLYETLSGIVVVSIVGYFLRALRKSDAGNYQLDSSSKGFTSDSQEGKKVKRCK